MECTYKIDGKANSKDLYPLNRELSCPNPITISVLSIVLPILIAVSILAFVIPKYVLPYVKEKELKKKLAQFNLERFSNKKKVTRLIALIIALCVKKHYTELLSIKNPSYKFE